MGERTSYTPGTFSWAELVTSDAGAAKGFYTQLFGWEYDDNPAGEGQIYSMAKRDGHSVAALYPGDQPPHWNCYVTVASADETAQKAQDAGGSIMAEPFDVSIRDESIRLGQFLKLANLVESGAEAKPLIADGADKPIDMGCRAAGLSASAWRRTQKQNLRWEV